MDQIESITEYLKRRLREAGAARFEKIAARASEMAGLSGLDSVRLSFIRKFVYGVRENPRIGTIQPLLDFFAAVDRGEEQLPTPDARAAHAHTEPDSEHEGA